MELLTLVRFRSNVELIRLPKPSNLTSQGLKFLLFSCIFIKIFTFENYEEPFIVSYCHIKLVARGGGGIFGFSWAVTSFGRIFCSVVTYYLLTTFFFFFGKRYQKAGTSWLYLLSLLKLGKQLWNQAKHLYIMEVVSGRILFQKLYVFHRMTLQRSYRIVSSSLLSPWYCCFYHILFLWSLTFFHLLFSFLLNEIWFMTFSLCQFFSSL